MKLPRIDAVGAARWLAAATFVLVLAAAPLRADTPTPDDRAAKEAPRAEAVLATEAAERVGIERVKSSARTESGATQITTDPTMKWLLIIGISALAIWLIVSLAD